MDFHQGNGRGHWYEAINRGLVSLFEWAAIQAAILAQAGIYSRGHKSQQYDRGIIIYAAYTMMLMNPTLPYYNFIMLSDETGGVDFYG